MATQFGVLCTECADSTTKEYGRNIIKFLYDNCDKKKVMKALPKRSSNTNRTLKTLMDELKPRRSQSMFDIRSNNINTASCKSNTVIKT